MRSGIYPYSDLGITFQKFRKNEAENNKQTNQASIIDAFRLNDLESLQERYIKNLKNNYSALKKNAVNVLDNFPLKFYR